MSCRSLYFRATQHPLAGFARSSFSRDWLSTESAGDSPHGAFPCRSPVTTAHHPSLPPPRRSRSRCRRQMTRVCSGAMSLSVKMRFPASRSCRRQMTQGGRGLANGIASSWSGTLTSNRKTRNSFNCIVTSAMNATHRSHTLFLLTPWSIQGVLSCLSHGS